MLNRLTSIIAFVLVALAVSPAWADEYSDTIAIFQNAGEVGCPTFACTSLKTALAGILPNSGLPAPSNPACAG